MKQVAIKSNHVITPEGSREAVIIIQDGKIEAVLQDPGYDMEVDDLCDLVIMPGIVDPHVHINEPGRTSWEGFDTATKAAIAGGITTLIEMPLNASPVTTTVAAFEEKINVSKGKLHCHCGFWGGIIPGNEKEIEPLVERGVFGFKAFLIDSGIDEFPPVSEDDLRKVMPVLSRYRLPLLVHCELEGPAPGSPSNTRSYKNYLASRPNQWEDDAIAMMIRLCGEFDCPTHIVHLSSAASLGQINRAKEKGLPLTVETVPHYLFFDAENIPDGGTAFKCAPPIRDRRNNEQLWEALKKGIIDFVATDHSPAPPELKELVTGDFMKAWGGIASLQLSLPVLWTFAQQHGAVPADMATWLSSNPAHLPGLENQKGRIAKGYDADLVAWDPGMKFRVTEDIIFHKHKITPYLNEELSGVVKHTWLKGEKVFEDGKCIDLGKGELLMRK